MRVQICSLCSFDVEEVKIAKKMSLLIKLWIISYNLSVLDLVSQVRDAVLMNVYLEVRNPRGRDFEIGGYISKGREMGSSVASNRRPSWTDPVTARRVPSKWKGIGKGSKGARGMSKGKGERQGECAMYIVICACVHNECLNV